MLSNIFQRLETVSLTFHKNFLPDQWNEPEKSNAKKLNEKKLTEDSRKSKFHASTSKAFSSIRFSGLRTDAEDILKKFLEAEKRSATSKRLQKSKNE